jgi:hypothetical protein
VNETHTGDVVVLKYLTKIIFAGYFLFENFVYVSNMEIAYARFDEDASAGATNQP